MEEPILTISTICEYLGLSRSHLHRLVSEQFELPISLYIRKKRLEKAASLLENPELRISEIADMVGINSHQNFSNYFNKEFGMSPSDYRKQIPEPVKDGLSLAVLPFINQSNDKEQEYFSDGITDELINVFSNVRSLKIVSRSSSFSFKGKHDDVRNIGKLLGADYLLEGSVRRSENRLRITAHLTNTVDGFQVWAQKYDREMLDILDIQDDISQAILEEIEINLLGKTAISFIKQQAYSTEAYELYLYGRYHFNKFAGPIEFEKSIEYYNKAISLEPNYAEAYAAMASSYLSLWFYRFLEPETGLVRIKWATNMAMQLNGKSSMSLLALARMQLLIDWDFQASEKSFLSSLELDVNNAEAHSQYALMLGLSDRFEEALKHLNIALKLDPLSLFINFYGEYVYWLCGEDTNATEICLKMIELEPQFWGGHTLMGFNYYKNGKKKLAIKELEVAKMSNYSGFTLGSLGSIYGFNGQKDKAIAMLEEMKNLANTEHVFNYDFGMVYASLGEIDISIHCFKKAIEKHEPPMLFFKSVLKDWLAPYQKDPRYIQLFNTLP